MTATVTSTQEAIELTSTELLAYWSMLDLGEPPAILRLRPPGHTVGERDALLEQAAYGRPELLRDNRIHAGLAHMLTTVAAADYHLDLRISDPRSSAPSVLGLGAIAGAHGVALACYDGDDNTSIGPAQLIAVDSTRVAATLMGMLNLHGPITPGTGVQVNIPLPALHQAFQHTPAGDIWALSDHLTTQGIAGTEARALARMMSGDHRIAGQLGATKRTGSQHDGHERASWVVGFHATEKGWFSQIRRNGTLTVAPTDTNRLMRSWQELIQTVSSAN